MWVLLSERNDLWPGRLELVDSVEVELTNILHADVVGDLWPGRLELVDSVEVELTNILHADVVGGSPRRPELRSQMGLLHMVILHPFQSASGRPSIFDHFPLRALLSHGLSVQIALSLADNTRHWYP